MPRLRTCFALSLLTLSLAACHGKGDATSASSPGADASGADAALPKPASAGGPVTGMPAKPGPGPVGPPVATSVEAPEIATVQTDTAQAPVAVGDTPPQNVPAAGDANAVPAEPTLDDAVAIVRGYYAALSAHDVARAHAYWAQGLRPSAEPGAEADTATLAADVGAPGRMEAAAGSRYVRVPVTLARTLRDGTTARGTATVTLRRAVVDGATPEQRAWRISAVEAAPSTAP